MSIQKFRPVLNAAQIDWIVSRAQDAPLDDYVAKSIIASLGVFAFKISNNLVKPASVSAPKLSMSDKLGFSESQLQEDVNSDAYRWTNNLMSPEEELAYENSLNQIAKGA